MNNNSRKRVQTIQASMVKSVESCFSESEQDGLRCLIRLTVEFDYYLKAGNPPLRKLMEQSQLRLNTNIQIKPKENELRYSTESIFWGIDSFCHVNNAYNVLVGATKSRVRWGKVSMSSLKKQFVSMFKKFTFEKNFEKKCRLLLDLFKVQIVFAGVFYD
jgi:hypothetical protein